MQPKTEDFLVNIEAYDTQEIKLRSFGLYEEYSHRSISETMRMCRENFEKTGFKVTKELEIGIESEIEDFRVWLEETKGFDSDTAHFYSVSLRSLLYGFPFGAQIASFFSIALDK